MKKLLSLVLALTIAMSMSVVLAAEEYSLPLTTTGETLVIAGPENSGTKTYASGLAVFEEMQRQTGVTIKFECTIGSDYSTAMQTRIAAGGELPDIIYIPGDAAKYGAEGVIIDMSDLIDQYAPNIVRWLDNEPVARMFITAADGAIYSLPNELVEGNGSGNDSIMPPATVIRADWIEKLGLEMPTTIDELEKVLIAFRDEDPNGNGINDEVPYSFPGGWNVVRFLGWSYGLHMGFNGGWYLNDEGDIHYEIVTDEFKELMTLANRWYEMGLIDQEFALNNWDKWNSQIMNSQTGCVPMSTIYPDAVWNSTIRALEGNDAAGLYPMYPVAGPEGKNISEASFASCNAAPFGITRDCKNPELAIKFLDYVCYSDQGTRWNEFGVEGVSYDMVNGVPVFKDEFLQSENGLTNAMWDLGGYHYVLPQVLTAHGRQSAFLQYESVFDISAKIYNEVTVNTPLLLYAAPTVEENERAVAISSDINTYVSEMIDKFILGTESLDNFDQFVETIKSMGLAEWTQIMQARYDRLNGQ